MATVGNTVASALWLLRVVDAEEKPSPAQYERCIEALNRAMARLEGSRVPLGWVPVSNPEQTLPLEPKHEDLAVHLLAVVARPIYGATLDADVKQRYRELLAALYSDMAVDSPIQSNHSLPEPDSRRNGRLNNITQGSGWA